MEARTRPQRRFQRLETDTHELPAKDLRDPAAKPLLVLTQVLEDRYRDLSFHGRSVSGYCAMTARELDLPVERIERVSLAGELHDVGKVGVDEDILCKAGPLTDAEWKQVKRHPEIGADLLFSSNLDDIASWVLAHHERPDGAGYPHGLGAGDISLESRILAVADAYDAMRSERIYKAALSHEEAARELRDAAGAQFDPEVVEVFLRALDRLDGEPHRPERSHAA